MSLRNLFVELFFIGFSGIIFTIAIMMIVLKTSYFTVSGFPDASKGKHHYNAAIFMLACNCGGEHY